MQNLSYTNHLNTSYVSVKLTASAGGGAVNYI